MPPLLQSVVEALSAFPTLYGQITLPDLLHFVNIARLLKPYILLSQSSYIASPPDSLTQSAHAFMSASLELRDDTIKLLWQALKHYIWELEYDEELHRELGSQYIPYFLREGIARQISTLLCSFV